jgi:hypothetical protein
MGLEISHVDIKKNHKFPEVNTKMAEFFGILAGDGYTNEYSHKTSRKRYTKIAGHKHDDSIYHKDYVKKIIKELFNIDTHEQIRKNENTRILRICSKGLFNYLKSKEFPLGEKGDFQIPSWICQNKKYQIAFIKGLADTDFTFHIKKNKNIPTIAIKGISHKMLKKCNEWLKEENITTYCAQCKNRYHYKGEEKYSKETLIQISSKIGVYNFMKKIGFRNETKKRKFREWHSSLGQKYEIFKSDQKLRFY